MCDHLKVLAPRGDFKLVVGRNLDVSGVPCFDHRSTPHKIPLKLMLRGPNRINLLALGKPYVCIPFKVWLQCCFWTLYIFDLSDKKICCPISWDSKFKSIFTRRANFLAVMLKLWSCKPFHTWIKTDTYVCQTLWKTRPGSPPMWIWPKSVHLWVQAEGCAKKYPRATAEISCLWEQTDRRKHNASGWGCRWRGDIAEMLIQLLSCLISQLEKTKLKTSLIKIL